MTYRSSDALIPPPSGASGMEARTTRVLALRPELFGTDTASPGSSSSTSALPEASVSREAEAGTVAPGLIERTRAAPPSVPDSASTVTNGVVAPAVAALPAGAPAEAPTEATAAASA
ncbi:hypothetical protein RLT59_37535 [Streptomyces sp. ITFR-6]|nr:hypothetical protein [Streptomyces sp. ITFR-6]WNI33870.1 hypothetical protein RLT59_37535 [Streptomyces sp. ITFR-6]